MHEAIERLTLGLAEGEPNRLLHAAALTLLETLAAGEVTNRITVDPSVAANARLALDRMLALA